jgi:hypothetical protein
MPCGRLGGVVVHTIALMIVRRVLGVLGCGPTPNADAVEIAVLRHQVAVEGCHARDCVSGNRWLLVRRVPDDLC